MKSWVGIGEGRVRKSVCYVGMSVKVLVIHCGIVQHNYRSIRQAWEVVYARFEAMSSLDKSSFVLGNELWEVSLYWL